MEKLPTFRVFWLLCAAYADKVWSLSPSHYDRKPQHKFWARSYPHRALCPALHPQRHCWLCWGQRWAGTAPAPHPHLLIWVGVWLLEVLKGSQGKQLTKNTTLLYRATMLTHTQSFLWETKPSAVLILLFGCISKVCMSYLGLFIN